MFNEEDTQGKIKCVCQNVCQAIHDNGSIIYHEPGSTAYFKECPPHFVPAGLLTEANVDFKTVSDVFLREDIIPVSDMVDFCQLEYSLDLNGRSRHEVVNALVHARTHIQQNLFAPGNAPTASEYKNSNAEASQGGISFDPDALDTTATVEEVLTTDVVEEQATGEVSDSLDELLNG